jgi:hypothetical protein
MRPGVWAVDSLELLRTPMPRETCSGTGFVGNLVIGHGISADHTEKVFNINSIRLLIFTKSEDAR